MATTIPNNLAWFMQRHVLSYLFLADVVGNIRLVHSDYPDCLWFTPLLHVSPADNWIECNLTQSRRVRWHVVRFDFMMPQEIQAVLRELLEGQS